MLREPGSLILKDNLIVYDMLKHTNKCLCDQFVFMLQ